MKGHATVYVPGTFHILSLSSVCMHGSSGQPNVINFLCANMAIGSMLDELASRTNGFTIFLDSHLLYGAEILSTGMDHAGIATQSVLKKIILNTLKCGVITVGQCHLDECPVGTL